MIGTVSMSVAAATLMDFIFPNIVFNWREKSKANNEKQLKLRRSYHYTKGRRTI